MKYILFPEGRILNNNGTYEYEYHLKDHLASVRVAFVPTVNGKEVVQENAYYPFGATIADLSYAAPLNNNRYGYTNQEQLNDFNLNWYDYIARNYNPLIGRFNSIDPLAEKYYSISPYAYCANSPLRYIDPTGMMYSEHIDEFGNMIAHYDDGDNSVYLHNTGTTEAQVASQRTALGNTGGDGAKIGELGGNIDISQIMPNKLALSSEASKKVNGLVEFGSMVQTGSALDLKSNKETIFGVAWAYDKANKTSTKFSFGDYSNMTAADVGNYHFGYIGRYTNNGEGFSPSTLWIGAGLAEIKKNIFDEGRFSTGLKGFTQLFGPQGPRPPFGDSMVDFGWSTVGMGDADKSKRR